MPAIWRPNVRVTLDEDGEVEDTESGGEEVTKKGTKSEETRSRKESEHGRKRSRCKECGGGLNLRARSKECGGAQSASRVQGLAPREHGRERARIAAGHQSASTVVERSTCKE